jgi:hypothetical protein
MNIKIKQFVMKLRFGLLRIMCIMLLPRDVWIGKHFGAYTQEYNIVFGRLDNSGILQGMTDEDVARYEQEQQKIS